MTTIAMESVTGAMFWPEGWRSWLFPHRGHTGDKPRSEGNCGLPDQANLSQLDLTRRPCTDPSSATRIADVSVTR